MLSACSLEQASGDDRVIDSSYVIMSIVVCNTNFKKKKKIVDRSVASENVLKPFYESISYSVLSYMYNTSTYINSTQPALKSSHAMSLTDFLKKKANKRHRVMFEGFSYTAST